MAELRIPASQLQWHDLMLDESTNQFVNLIVAVWPPNQWGNPALSQLVTVEVQSQTLIGYGDWNISFPPDQLVTVQRGSPA